MIRLLLSALAFALFAAPALAQDDELPPLPTRAEVLAEIEAAIDEVSAQEGVLWEVEEARRSLDYIWSGAGNMDSALQQNNRAAIQLRLEDRDATETDTEAWFGVAQLIARNGTDDQAAAYLERARVWSERLAPPNGDYFYDAEERLAFLEQLRQRLNANVTVYASWAVPRHPDFDRERSAADLRDALSEYVSPRIAPIERFALRFAENDECRLALEILRVGEIRDDMDRAQHNLLERELGGDPLSDLISVSHHVLPFERSSRGLRGATLIRCGQFDALLNEYPELARDPVAMVFDSDFRRWDWMVQSGQQKLGFRRALGDHLAADAERLDQALAEWDEEFAYNVPRVAGISSVYDVDVVAACSYLVIVLDSEGQAGMANQFRQRCWSHAQLLAGEHRVEALAWLALALPE
ncbi:hypothetical protein [Hyphobacterium sp.]|uniref:hypothetical protein n=1 Tax=Hyphobacterium sp. TaxID=2004662 RepID=UPI00374A48FD